MAASSPLKPRMPASTKCMSKRSLPCERRADVRGYAMDQALDGREDVDHAARDHVAGPFGISLHVGRGCVSIQGFGTRPFLHNHEGIQSKLCLEGAEGGSIH